nr:hypothetical protein [Tanacetum cinerariifolium]
RASRAQDGGEHFLDCGLSAGAGDGGNLVGERGAIQRTQLAESQASVGHHQLRQRGIRHFALHQGGHRAFLRDLFEVIVAIEAWADQGDEQITDIEAAAVDADRVETAVGTDQARIQRAGQLAEGHGIKHVRPPRQPGLSRPRASRRKGGARRRSLDSPRALCRP